MEGFDDADLVSRIARRPNAGVHPQRPFQPWHRPRKQWIRRYQWHDSLFAMLQDTHFPADGRILRYLSLPGDDLLDVRVLREACETAAVDLRFTGLNSVGQGSARDVQLNIAESEVRGLARIHSGSSILRERFEAVANTGSLAFAEVRNGAPFHVVNIDLCDHIARRAQGEGQPTVIDALAEVIQLQLRHAMHPWLLFITTRVAPRQIDVNNLAALIRAVSDNVSASDEFRLRTAALLQTGAEGLQGALADPDILDPQAFMNLFALGFGKWLLRFVGEAHPDRILRMLPSCFYTVHPGRPDMLSLSFRCDVRHAPARDRYEIVGNGGAEELENEIDQAIGLLDATEDMFDLDVKLAGDPQLAEAVTVESSELLKSAHYDVDGAPGYRGWLATAPPKTAAPADPTPIEGT